MAALKCACPNCRRPMQINQALPAKIQCPNCRKVFTASAPKSAIKTNNSSQAIAPHAGAAAPGQPVMGLPAGSAGHDTRDRFSSNGMRPPAGSRRQARSRSRNSGFGVAIAVIAGIFLLAVMALAVGGFFLLKKGDGNTSDDVAIGDNFDSKADVPIFGDRKNTVRSDPEVERAIDLGVKYLKRRIHGRTKLYYFGGNSDPHVGAMALAALTLLECGVPYTDSAVQKAITTVHKAGNEGDPKNPRKGLRFTYSVALSVLFLDRLVADKKMPEMEKEKHRRLIRKFALQLIAAQQPAMNREIRPTPTSDLEIRPTPAGGWNYQCQILSPQDEQRLMRILKNNTFVPGKFHVAGQPAFNYRDNSIAQFVLLALWNARKHGVPVAKTLITEEKRYLQEQQPKGYWTYNEKVLSSADATTCAGLIGLAVGRAIRAEMANPNGKSPTTKEGNVSKKADVAKLDLPMQAGLKHIGTVIGKKSDLTAAEKARRHNHTRQLDGLWRKLLEAPPQERVNLVPKIRELDNDALATGIIFDADAWGDLYFLWSVERVAVIYGLEKIPSPGGQQKDWYGWGRDIILKNQVTDPKKPQDVGSWQERFPGVPDTCFALLFLKRANIVKDLSDKLKQLMSAARIESLPAMPLPPRRDA